MHWEPSDELDRIKLGSAEEERRRAKEWMDTAAQHARNEAYWRVRALKAEGRELSADDAALLDVMSKALVALRIGDQIVDENMREALAVAELARGKIAFEAFIKEQPLDLGTEHLHHWEMLPDSVKKMWVRIATEVVSSLTPDW